MASRNIIELLKDYSQDIYPVKSLGDVGPLTYILERDGEEALAANLRLWKEKIERRINEEFHITADA